MRLPTRITWVVVANSEHCRAYEERRRGARLGELTYWEWRPSEQDRRHAERQKAVQRQRFGYGQSVVNLHDFGGLVEQRFLARYAHLLSLVHAKGRFERLVLIAPPRSLGVLRKELGVSARRSVELTLTCDCVEESAETLRSRLRSLRLPA